MSNRAIGRELGLYKGTVNKYVGLILASYVQSVWQKDDVLRKKFSSTVLNKGSSQGYLKSIARDLDNLQMAGHSGTCHLFSILFALFERP